MENLDQDELLHLAVQASQQGNAEKSLDYLKRAEKLGVNAKVLHMMAAEHASLGLYDRAVIEMQQAVQLDPSMHIASFQLGLLNLTMGNPAAAIDAWNKLDALPEEHFLQLFRKGLIALITDNFIECKQFLESGISSNTVIEPLNNDMKKILEALPTNHPPESTEDSSSHILLNSYRN